jgi:tRNA nucleotidyltransferase (CCA-adding enzyme)
VEVFGLTEQDLLEVLRQIGKVNAVGRAFGVFKVRRGACEIDVSLPRRDSKVGSGHRGIRVEGDPTMTPVEASRRRDLTINAIMKDPLTGDLLDPEGGVDDLRERRLRAVDPQTFLEDPLRALRVVQFAARFDFDADDELVSLCRDAALAELPAERVQAEWLKLLLKGRRPSTGLAFARRADVLARVFPEATAADHHDVDVALDRLAADPHPPEPEGRRLAVLLAAWLHRASPADVDATLDRLWLHRWKGYPLRDRVRSAVACWSEEPAHDAALRHLSTRTELQSTFLVRAAVTADPKVAWRLERAAALGILVEPPEAILKGRHLQALGFEVGPTMGLLLRHVYQLQLDGSVTDLDRALLEARRWQAEHAP